MDAEINNVIYMELNSGQKLRTVHAEKRSMSKR